MGGMPARALTDLLQAADFIIKEWSTATTDLGTRN